MITLINKFQLLLHHSNFKRWTLWKLFFYLNDLNWKLFIETSVIFLLLLKQEHFRHNLVYRKIILIQKNYNSTKTKKLIFSWDYLYFICTTCAANGFQLQDEAENEIPYEAPKTTKILYLSWFLNANYLICIL